MLALTSFSAKKNYDHMHKPEGAALSPPVEEMRPHVGGRSALHSRECTGCNTGLSVVVVVC